MSHSCLTRVVRKMFSGLTEARRQSNATIRRSIIERRTVAWETRRKMWREVAEKVKQENP